MDVPHPWRRLRRTRHVRLTWHDDEPGALRGLTDHEAGVISLRRGMTWEQRRCSLMHELVHFERGPVPTTLVGREERRVRLRTARIMLPDLRALADALAWAPMPAEAAEELGVDVETLMDRLRNLQPSERSYLVRRAALRDGTPA